MARSAHNAVDHALKFLASRDLRTLLRLAVPALQVDEVRALSSELATTRTWLNDKALLVRTPDGYVLVVTEFQADALRDFLRRLAVYTVLHLDEVPDLHDIVPVLFLTTPPRGRLPNPLPLLHPDRPALLLHYRRVDISAMEAGTLAADPSTAPLGAHHGLGVVRRAAASIAQHHPDPDNALALLYALCLHKGLTGELLRGIFDTERLKMSDIFREIDQTAFERGRLRGEERGREEGHEEGTRDLALRLLSARLSIVPPALVRHVAAADPETLCWLALRLLDPVDADQLLRELADRNT